jgi:hypothetical protein
MLSPDTCWCSATSGGSSLGDFGIVIRPDHDRPILNSVQWWPVASKARLIALYEQALAYRQGAAA